MSRNLNSKWTQKPPYVCNSEIIELARPCCPTEDNDAGRRLVEDGHSLKSTQIPGNNLPVSAASRSTSYPLMHIMIISQCGEE